MLEDYFSIVISEEGSLLALPSIIPSFHIFDENLIRSLVRDIVFHIEWDEEKPCLNGIALVLAKYYSIALMDAPQHIIIHSFFPLFKKAFFYASISSTPETSFIAHLADIKDLYKIFERC